MKTKSNKRFAFKTKIIHKLIWKNGKPYYRCNHAVGVLSGQQIILKTNRLKENKITCKNCLKWK